MMSVFRSLRTFSSTLLFLVLLSGYLLGCAGQPQIVAPAASAAMQTPPERATPMQATAEAIANRQIFASLTPTPMPTPEKTPVPTQTGLSFWQILRIKKRPTPTPALATPQIVRRNGRIDKIGPIALPTVAPLSVGEGLPPVRLQIPVLELDAPIKTMGWVAVTDAKGRTHSEWDVVDNAVGHHFNTVFPGEAGNIALSGHNNIEGAVFAPVCVIGEPGVVLNLKDEIILTDSGGRRFTYRITGWDRIKEKNASIAKREDNARYLQPTAQARLTLVTCWPVWSNTHRVVITAALTDIEK